VPVTLNRLAAPLCVFIFGMVAVVSNQLVQLLPGHAAILRPHGPSPRWAG